MKVKLDPGAKCPTRAYAADAGLDLYSRDPDIVIEAGESHVFPTGVHVELPHGTVGDLESKSGLFIRHGIISLGTVDEGYTGEIFVRLVNTGKSPVIIRRGEKITHLVIKPIVRPSVEIVDEISGGPRGDNGLGSTGR